LRSSPGIPGTWRGGLERRRRLISVCLCGNLKLTIAMTLLILSSRSGASAVLVGKFCCTQACTEASAAGSLAGSVPPACAMSASAAFAATCCATKLTSSRFHLGGQIGGDPGDQAHLAALGRSQDHAADLSLSSACPGSRAGSSRRRPPGHGEHLHPFYLDRLQRKVVALADATFDFSRASSFSSALAPSTSWEIFRPSSCGCALSKPAASARRAPAAARRPGRRRR